MNLNFLEGPFVGWINGISIASDRQAFYQTPRALPFVGHPSGETSPPGFFGWLTCEAWAALARREWIIIQGGTGLPEPAQPILPLGTEFAFQFLAKSFCKSARVSSSGDGDLQRAALNDGRIVEVAEGTIANHIAQNSALALAQRLPDLLPWMRSRPRREIRHRGRENRNGA